MSSAEAVAMLKNWQMAKLVLRSIVPIGGGTSRQVYVMVGDVDAGMLTVAEAESGVGMPFSLVGAAFDWIPGDPIEKLPGALRISFNDGRSLILYNAFRFIAILRNPSGTTENCQRTFQAVSSCCGAKRAIVSCVTALSDWWYRGYLPIR